MFRTGVKAELEEVAGDRIDIIGEAPDVDTAIAVIRRDLPDVVLLDVHLPGGNGRGGVDVLAGCVAAFDNTEIIAEPTIAVVDPESGSIVRGRHRDFRLGRWRDDQRLGHRHRRSGHRSGHRRSDHGRAGFLVGLGIACTQRLEDLRQRVAAHLQNR